MKIIVPSDKEVWDSLRKRGCAWIGGHGCECYSRQLKNCFEDEKEYLTRTEYTDEEIAASQIENQKLWDEIFKMI